MDRPWRCTVWPPRSPDLYTADCQVWVCMKAMMYARKVHTTGQLPWRTLRAARCSNKGSVATLVRICIQTDGGLFEQPTYVAHYATVLVYLTARLNKYRTVYRSATAVKTTVVYTIFPTQDLPLELNPAVVALKSWVTLYTLLLFFNITRWTKLFPLKTNLGLENIN
jgi:hypothetical protein